MPDLSEALIEKDLQHARHTYFEGPKEFRMPIQSIRGSATRQFILERKSKFSGLDEELAFQRLAELDAADSLLALGALKSVGLHKMKGSLADFWSIKVNGPWRILFRFAEGDAHEVHIIDPH